MTSDSLADLTVQLRRFADERDWQQFHSPKKLAAATRKVAINTEKYPVEKSRESNRNHTGL